MTEYTRGGPITKAEAQELADNNQWAWLDHRRLYWSIDRIEDDHLMMVERFLLGRATDFKKHNGFGPGVPGWERSYNAVRDEMEKRGLEAAPIYTA